MSIKVFIFGNRRFYEEFTCMVFIWPFEAVLFSFSPFSNLIPQYTKESTVFSIPLEHRNCPWFIYIATNCLASIFWGRTVFKFVVLSVLNQFDSFKTPNSVLQTRCPYRWFFLQLDELTIMLWNGRWADKSRLFDNIVFFLCICYSEKTHWHLFYQSLVIT